MSTPARPGAGEGIRAAVPDADALVQHLDRADYLADAGLATAMFLALRLPQPLLLEGEAGVGKTEAAKALAVALGTPLIRLQCYEGIDVAEALYEWNYPRQLLTIRLAEARGSDLREEQLFGEDYLIRRPLLQAIEHPGPLPAVLLVDELDLQKPPGIAEGIDWVAALELLGAARLSAEAADATLGSVLKYREDQELVRERGSGWLVGQGSG